MRMERSRRSGAGQTIDEGFVPQDTVRLATCLELGRRPRMGFRLRLRLRFGFKWGFVCGGMFCWTGVGHCGVESAIRGRCDRGFRGNEDRYSHQEPSSGDGRPAHRSKSFALPRGDGREGFPPPSPPPPASLIAFALKSPIPASNPSSLTRSAPPQQPTQSVCPTKGSPPLPPSPSRKWHTAPPQVYPPNLGRKNSSPSPLTLQGCQG